MKTIQRLVLALSFLFATGFTHGAIIMVSPGQSVQAAVNAASSGDQIVLQSGSYNEDVVINGKTLALRSFGVTSEVKTLSVVNSPGLFVAQNLQFTDFNSSNTDLLIKRSIIGNNLTIIGGNVQVLQSSIYEKLTCKAATSFICYNTIRYAEIEGNSTITGNHFDGRSLKGIGIDLNGAQTKATIRNNRIHSYQMQSYADDSNVCIGIRVRGLAKASIINNVIYDCYDSDHRGTEDKVGMGIYVESTLGTTILGNALWNCFVENGIGSYPGNRLIWATPSGAIALNNLFWKSHGSQGTVHVGGGVVDRDSVDGDPKFVNLNGGDFTLQADSPAKNAGPADAQHNDRDGTRNDIGMYGGHNFIPDGKTTNKPIALGLDAAPIAVPVGGIITIQSTGATAK